jgi:transglutaminase-like putative cysteine protease
LTFSFRVVEFASASSIRIVFMTIFSVRHSTTYRYKRDVGFGEHRLMYRPRDSYDQRLIEESLVVHPEPAEIHWMHDVFGNCVAHVTFLGRARELRFDTHIRLEHKPSAAPDVRIDDKALTYPFEYDRDELPDLASCIRRHFDDDDGAVAAWARQFATGSPEVRTGKLLMTLCYAIHEGFSYSRRSEHGTQPPLITLHSRKGSCRDFALLMIEAVRSLGFAARFVTGYIYVASRDGMTNLGGGSTHAWCQVYLPGAGWVEFDPTNGIVGNRDLIRIAVARDPRQAVPLSGSYFGRAADDLGMTVQVNVTTEPGPKGAR